MAQVTIIFKKTRCPTALDLDFISTIVRDRNLYVEMAIKFLLDDSKSHLVGETDVGNPQLIFRLDRVWEVHFHDAFPDRTEGLGVLVAFNGERPEFVELLRAEVWFDSDSGEWVPS